jgi:bifunctional enzyme CysN/CysC
MANTVVNLQQPTASATGKAPRESLKIVIVGHVDHGKSTLIGRLLYDTNSLPEEKIRAVEEVSRKRGKPVEWAFLLDAFQAERDQGITIDSSRIGFHTEKRDYLIIDAPGHKEFIANMVSGAASADAALLVIDAHEGVREQSRRHGYLLNMLGIQQVAVIVNKMDQPGFAQKRFKEVEREIADYLSSIGVTPTFIIPVSARGGQNIATSAEEMPWYTGVTVLSALDTFVPRPAAAQQDLRMPVQDVYKFDDRRIVVGRIETGTLRVGDKLLFSPSNKIQTVKTIEAWNEDVLPMKATAGQTIGFTLEEQIFVERGDIVSHPESAPFETNVFKAHLFWLGHKPLEIGKIYTMKLATMRRDVIVERIERLIDTDTLKPSEGTSVARHGIAQVVVRTRRGVVALDEYRTVPSLGRFVMLDGYDVVGGGIVSMDGYPDQRSMVTVKSTNITPVDYTITREMREKQTGHKGGVLWLTGLSGAGKSTLAVGLERELFRRGYHVYVLDGDNIRAGLNSNLGFSPEDRAENIRRVGEVAGLFAQSGMIVITAFISPYRTDRDRARDAAGEQFHEIYVSSDLATCESRDIKGLYAKARRGEIPEFTGISAPYEAPLTPELLVDTQSQSVEECVVELADYVAEEFKIRDL